MNTRGIIFDFIIDHPNLYRIAWREKATGIFECSQYSSSCLEAESIVRELNIVHSECEFWIESNPRLN